MSLTTLITQYGPAALSGGTLWMIYAALWRHSPTKFPRTADEWWGWIRGSNQEIAAQHNGGQPVPTAPADPANQQ